MAYFLFLDEGAAKQDVNKINQSMIQSKVENLETMQVPADAIMGLSVTAPSVQDNAEEKKEMSTPSMAQKKAAPRFSYIPLKSLYGNTVSFKNLRVSRRSHINCNNFKVCWTLYGVRMSNYIFVSWQQNSECIGTVIDKTSTTSEFHRKKHYIYNAISIFSINSVAAIKLSFVKYLPRFMPTVVLNFRLWDIVYKKNHNKSSYMSCCWLCGKESERSRSGFKDWFVYFIRFMDTDMC